MTVSDEAVQAACDAYYEYVYSGHIWSDQERNDMRRAIEAADKVRGGNALIDKLRRWEHGHLD